MINQVNQLQKENTQLNNSLFEVNRKLRDSERLKSHFISNITNEIINPFTGITALAERIKMLGDGEMNRARQMAALIFEESSHLDFQLRNIFAVAAIEAGIERPNYTKVSLSAVVQRIKDVFQHLMDKKNISLIVRCLPDIESWGEVEIISDFDKLTMILNNLVSNSIKFSQEESVIDVLIEFNEGSYQVSISDYGKGIEVTDRKIIFDRFKQLDEKINSVNTGQGLGLSIVKAYTEMLDGTIEVSDNVNGGTKIILKFQEQQSDDFDDLEGFLMNQDSLY